MTLDRIAYQRGNVPLRTWWARVGSDRAKEVCAEAGISFPHFKHVAAGRRRFSRESAEVFARATGIGLEALLPLSSEIRREASRPPLPKGPNRYKLSKDGRLTKVVAATQPRRPAIPEQKISSPTPPAKPPQVEIPDAITQIARLKQLLDEGVISAPEFTAKKRELLDRI